MQYGVGVAELESGIPREHSNVFRKVARETDTIIASREVGVYATGLIREGYATKGYHVKAKSCNWGPMAGFVLADPALGKKGTSGKAKGWQLSKINAAIKAGSIVVPLVISNARRIALPLLMIKTAQYYETEEIRLDAEVVKINVWSKQKEGALTCSFTLLKINQLMGCFKPIGASPNDWIVCYAQKSSLINTCEPRFYKQVTTNTIPPQKYYQLCALSNPLGSVAKAPTTYKAAQTGDYDLWGVFPKIKQRSVAEKGLHRSVLKALRKEPTETRVKTSFWERDVIGSHQYVRTYADYGAQEGEHTGNMSLLIEEIAVRINVGCMREGSGGWVVHHSDEAGRPMVDEIDAKAVVYFPNGNVWVMDNEDDVRNLRREIIILNYKPLFNPIWNYKLGIGREDIMRDWRSRNNSVNFPI